MSKPANSPPERDCEWCSRAIVPKQTNKGDGWTRFCDRSCSAKWRAVNKPHTPEHMAKMRAAGMAVLRGSKRPDASERMKRLNSDPAFRAKLDDISRSRKGQSWIGKRGGNGFLTEPQKKLCAALGWPENQMEWAIPTAPVKGQFPSLPKCYKVDLACPYAKIAIEVDGVSHTSKKWKFLDARKTAVLEALGWKVLRFTNKQVNEELPSIISKLQTTTIISPIQF